MPEEVPPGFCQCGCGEPAPLAAYTQASRGYVKGQPLRFIAGHHKRRPRRLRLDESYYRVEARGYDTPCWIWTRSIDSKGYGQAWSPDAQKPRRAHRLMYEQEVGPIPDSLELDHLCLQTECVRPSHLEPVTTAENIRRQADQRIGAERITAILALDDGLRTRGRIAKILGEPWDTVNAVLTRHGSLAASSAGLR